jgi:predicted dehydrogenase
MYLETLETLDEVMGIVLVDPDATTRDAISARTDKVAGAYGCLEAARARHQVTHALVALPNDEAPAAIVAAVEAGIGVFTEKPGARSAAEFEPVLAALDRRPVPFAIAYQNRWSPRIRQMRDLFQAGAIGRLASVELRMVTTRVGLRDPTMWLFQHKRAGGGVLTWLGCHWFDALRYITGQEIVRVQAELATNSGEAIDVEDTAAVSFRTQDGAVGSMHAAYVLAVGNPGYRSAGNDIAMILRGTLGALSYTASRTDPDAPLQLESVAPEWRTASLRAFGFTAEPSRGYGGLAGLDFFRAFLAAKPGDATPANAIDALRLLEVLDAIYAAAAAGHAIEVKRQRV